ncbi:MAG TPA: hypothetical protein VEZ90_17240, partial [Blastocatellia bacterium]|nr:hypothetical protein [Blastocatellia bacterium]
MNTPNYETIGSIVLAGSGGKEDSARLTSGAAPVRVRVSIALISAVLGIGVFACSGLAAGQTGPQMRLTLECDKQTPLP